MPHSTNGLGEAGKLVYRSFPGLRAHVHHHDQFCHHRGRNSNGRAVPTPPTVARAAQLGILGGMLVIGGGAGWQQLSPSDDGDSTDADICYQGIDNFFKLFY